MVGEQDRSSSHVDNFYVGMNCSLFSNYLQNISCVTHNDQSCHQSYQSSEDASVEIVAVEMEFSPIDALGNSLENTLRNPPTLAALAFLLIPFGF